MVEYQNLDRVFIPPPLRIRGYGRMGERKTEKMKRQIERRAVNYIFW